MVQGSSQSRGRAVVSERPVKAHRLGRRCVSKPTVRRKTQPEKAKKPRPEIPEEVFVWPIIGWVWDWETVTGAAWLIGLQAYAIWGIHWERFQ